MARGTAALVLACAPVALGDRLAAQPLSIHATRVVAFDDQGRAGGGIFDPGNALGAPDGSLGVHSLGIGGSLTLGFDVTVVDGPGADLVVFENPFRSGSEPWKTFAEACFVEVSSDGVHFARFPARYTGPQADPGPFSFVDVGFYAGLGGLLPGNLSGDPQDVVGAGGDAFDLADLAVDPLVIGGRVDLDAITQVRLVDVRSGVDVDSRGTLVRDPGAGSADIDAVTALHHASNRDPRAPRVELLIPADGDFVVRFSDPDGLADLDPTSLRAALWGNEVPIADLFAVAGSIRVDANGFTLQLGGALPAEIRLHLKFSVRDRSGLRSGAQRTR